MLIDMARRPTPLELIELYKLQPMVQENVLFRQTWVSALETRPGKSLGTCIVALLTHQVDSFSDMHRLATDEIWHFYLGDPIELLLLYPDGYDELILLGQDVLAGEQLQFVVRAGTWMGARLKPGGDYGLFGNTMAPGFSLEDFELPDTSMLLAQFPHRADLIRAMSR